MLPFIYHFGLVWCVSVYAEALYFNWLLFDVSIFAHTQSRHKTIAHIYLMYVLYMDGYSTCICKMQQIIIIIQIVCANPTLAPFTFTFLFFSASVFIININWSPHTYEVHIYTHSAIQWNLSATKWNEMKPIKSENKQTNKKKKIK